MVGRPPRERAIPRANEADIRRRPATPGDCRAWSSAHKAIPGDVQRRPDRDWGSRGRRFNPAVPTGNRTFSNIVMSHKSQQKSQLVVQRPSQRRAPKVSHALTGHVPPRQSRPRPTVTEPKITEPPHICTATPPTANRPAPSAPTGGTAPAGHGQTKALKLGPPTAAVDARQPAWNAAPRTGRHDCSDLHRPWTQAASSLRRKCRPGQQPMRCTDK